jgi:predicted DNA-binding transcriptional regulator AlpA
MQHLSDESELWRLPEVLAYLRVGRTSFYEGMALDIYPRPIKMGKRTKLWLAREIKALVKLAIAKRSDPESVEEEVAS